MTATADRDVDHVALLPIADARRVDAESWARAEAKQLAEVAAIRNDALTLEAVAVLLQALAEAAIPEGFSWRFALFAGPDVAPLWADVGFSPALAPVDEAWERMIGESLAAPQGRDVSDFELNGRRGRHCIRFGFRDPETNEPADTGELWASAAVVCRRQLGSEEMDVLAGIRTPNLDELFALLPAVYELVTGDLITALAEGNG